MEKMVFRTQLEVPVEDLPFLIICNSPFRISKCREKSLHREISLRILTHLKSLNFESSNLQIT